MVPCLTRAERLPRLSRLFSTLISFSLPDGDVERRVVGRR